MKSPFRLLALGSVIALLVVVLSPVKAAPPDATEALDLSPWQGQVVLVDFWASWCVPCRESFPWMAEMLERYGEQGLTIVAVNLDQDPEAATAFLADVSGGFQHINDPDGKIPEAFGITVMPSSVLFDRDGKPVYRHEGFRSDQKAEYERKVVALLKGQVDPDQEAIALVSQGRRGPGIRPWQRDLLADDAMRLDADALDLAIDDHIYFSKEASSGGRGFGGGGCGCN